MLSFGNDSPEVIYIGNDNVAVLYYGSELIWSSSGDIWGDQEIWGKDEIWYN